MSATGKWLSHDAAQPYYLATLPVKELVYEVLPSEEAVGCAMLDEIRKAAPAKDGSLVMILVGERGGQALHRLLGAMAKTNEPGLRLRVHPNVRSLILQNVLLKSLA